MTIKSCIYEGSVEHRRLLPVKNEFTYGALYYFLDLDEVPSIFKFPFLFSYNFPGILSFWRKNYYGDKSIPLKEAIANFVEKETGTPPRGPIRLLTNISYFGFCFNPASFYYCYGPDGETLETIVLEVTNTPWRERHQYLMKYTGEGRKTFALKKVFHVSPFMPMEIDYTWVFNNPHEDVFIYMQNRKTNEKDLLFDSTLKVKRLPLTKLNILKTFIKYPFVTLKTAIAIYWQALILFFIKKTPFYEHPSYGE